MSVPSHPGLLLGVTAVALLLTLPGLPPDTTFTSVLFHPPPPWSGPLEPNEKLNTVERLFEGQLKGPESFAARGGWLYTGLMDGRIVRVHPVSLELELVYRMGGEEECREQHQEARCGRPLGLAFTKSGELLVCDAIHGLYMLHLEEEVVRRTMLLPIHLEIQGKQHKVYNSIAISEDDQTVYLTVSSTRFPLNNAMLEVTSSPSGRLVRYHLGSGEVEVLAEGLSFPNGLELGPGGEFLLLTETGRARIHKHTLRGARAGRTEVLVDNLPGLPDNIRATSRGTFLVGLYPRHPDRTQLLELLGPHNLVRKLVVRLASLLLLPVRLANSVVPVGALLRLEYWCGNFEPFAHLAPPYGLVVEVEATGTIVSSLHSTNGAVRFIAEAFTLDRWMFFGSPYSTYLGRVDGSLLEDSTPEAMGDT